MTLFLKNIILIPLLREKWRSKMSLTIIAAVSENNVIGIENRIPWHIKEDIDRFKQLTTVHPIIMGRKTYESLPKNFRPLPQRKNIVLSSTLEPTEGIYIARNLEEALKLAEEQDTYVIGGKTVYELLLPIANKMEITKVHTYFLGDTFFPEVNWNDWGLIHIHEGRKLTEE